jgi:hypothetical protein
MLAGFLNEAFSFTKFLHYIVVTTPTLTLQQYDDSGKKIGPWVLPLLQKVQKGALALTQASYQIEKPQGLSGTFLIIPPPVDETIKNKSGATVTGTGYTAITVRGVEVSTFNTDTIVQRFKNRPPFAIINLPAQPLYVDFSTNPHSGVVTNNMYQNTFFGGVFQIAP